MINISSGWAINYLGSPLANGGASPHKKGRIAQFHEDAGFFAIHKETGSSDTII